MESVVPPHGKFVLNDFNIVDRYRKSLNHIFEAIFINRVCIPFAIIVKLLFVLRNIYRIVRYIQACIIVNK